MKDRVLVSTLRTVAAERGVELQSFSSDWIIRMRRGPVVHWVVGYDFDLNTCCAQQLAKDKAGASLVLELSGVPRIEHVLFNHPQNPAWVPATGTWPAIFAYARAHGFDVVAKPNDGSGGRAVARATSITELEQVVMKLFENHRAIALSPFHAIENEYRLVCLLDQILVAYRKLRTVLVGDGSSTRMELLAKHVRASSNGAALARSVAALETERLDLHAVVPAGERWSVNWKHNLGQGAQVELLSVPHPLFASLQSAALSAMRALNLQLASVDIAEIAGTAELKVLEVNAGIMMESFASIHPQGGAITASVYRAAVEAMFP